MKKFTVRFEYGLGSMYTAPVPTNIDFAQIEIWSSFDYSPIYLAIKKHIKDNSLQAGSIAYNVVLYDEEGNWLAAFKRLPLNDMNLNTKLL